MYESIAYIIMNIWDIYEYMIIYYDFFISRVALCSKKSKDYDDLDQSYSWCEKEKYFILFIYRHNHISVHQRLDKISKSKYWDTTNLFILIFSVSCNPFTYKSWMNDGYTGLDPLFSPKAFLFLH